MKTNYSALVLALAGLVLLAFLGTRGLNEPDEGRYGEISREMAASSNWLVPHLNGVPHFQKPPMLYWVMAASIRLLGPNEWAARLPSALAAWGTLAATMFMAGRLFGATVRWRTGLVLLSCGGFFGIARLASTDMLLTFWITLALAGLVARQTRGGFLPLLVFYGSMGLGFLTKGPMALLVPCSAAAGWLLARRRLGETSKPQYWLVGLMGTLLIGLSWFLLLVREYPGLVDYFVRYELVDRIASSVHKRDKPFWFYPSVLLGELMPWTPLLFVAAGLAFRMRRALALKSEAWFLLIWIALPLLVLSLVHSKLATYVLPLLPAFAIFLARSWDRILALRVTRMLGRGVALLLAVALVMAPILIFVAEEMYATTIKLSPWVPWTWVFGIILFLALQARMTGEPAPPAFMPWLACGVLLIYVVAASQADALMLGGNANLRKLAAVIQKEEGSTPAEVFVCDVRGNGLEFYLGRLVSRTASSSDVVLPPADETRERIITDSTNELQSLATRPAFILVKASRFLSDPMFRGWEVRASAGSCVLLGNTRLRSGTIARNEPAPGHPSPSSRIR